MTQSGRVKELDGEYAVVEILRDSACASCSSAHSCIGCKKLITTRARNSAGAQPGDTVTVESPSGRVLLYAFCVFVLPLLCAIAAYCAGICFLKEKYALICALAGFVLAFLFVFLVTERRARGRDSVEITHIENR